MDLRFCMHGHNAARLLRIGMKMKIVDRYICELNDDFACW